jgi:hypothetical protein
LRSAAVEIRTRLLTTVIFRAMRPASIAVSWPLFRAFFAQTPPQTAHFVVMGRAFPRGSSARDPLDFIEGARVVGSVVESGGAGRLVPGAALRDFERAPVLQIG